MQRPWLDKPTTIKEKALERGTAFVCSEPKILRKQVHQVPLARRFFGLLLAALVALGADATLAGENPRPRLTVEVASHQVQILATSGSYHCLPRQGPDVCQDRMSGPLPLNGRVPVHECARVHIRLGYPAKRVAVDLETRDQVKLAELAPKPRPRASRKHFNVRMPAQLVAADRLHVYVTHIDGNRGDFEAGLVEHSHGTTDSVLDASCKSP